MNFYEMVYIARGELTQQQINNLNAEITNVITSGGGKVSKVEHWGVRNLAYKIKKRHKGHYCLLNIEADPVVLKELDRKVKLNEAVLRSLIFKVDELDNKPSIMMSRIKRERDEEHSVDTDATGSEENTQDKTTMVKAKKTPN